MEFRKILYIKNKNVNTKNCSMPDWVRDKFRVYDAEESMVLRILVDNDNKVVIEYANPISLENIRDATNVDVNALLDEKEDKNES